MIRTDKEYKTALLQLTQYRQRRQQQQTQLATTGLTAEQLNRVFEPEDAFYDQIQCELEEYDRLRQKEPGALDRYRQFDDLGKLLIALRIHAGMSQAELAKQLEVDPSQVSRDERNEYSGITATRAQKIAEACQASLHIACVPSLSPPMPTSTGIEVG